MTPQCLDTAYSAFSQILSDVGEKKASLFFARFALLAMLDIDDLQRIEKLIKAAADGLTNDEDPEAHS